MPRHRPIPHRAGFTLMEVIIALGVGMFVVLTAYMAIRSAARTIKAADRLALENRLLRAGVVRALDEADFWTLYDDPLAAAGSPQQGLRASALDSVNVNFVDRTYGLPFTPLKDIPPDNEFAAGGSGISLRPDAPILAGSQQLADVEADGAIFVADSDRGWDPHRPYQANDPANWHRGTPIESGLGRGLLGRYALFTHTRKRPTLGNGGDARNPGYSRILAIRETGPFGQQEPPFDAQGKPFDPLPPGMLKKDMSRTFTRAENRQRYIWEALGHFALFDYLPANTLVGWHGLQRTTGDIDEQRDPRVASRLGPRRYGFDGKLAGTKYYSSFPRELTANTLVAMVPTSLHSGSQTVGFAIDSDLDGIDNSWGAGSDLTFHQRHRLHRFLFYGPASHIYPAGLVFNRLLQIPPLMPIRPADWPDLRLGVARTMLRGRPTVGLFVRWLDQSSGAEVELSFAALGTTLRGARQQRHRDGGWAVFRGVSYLATEDRNGNGLLDPGEDRLANGKLDVSVMWDNPRPSYDPAFQSAQDNDPTLDYPADDPVTHKPLVPARRAP